MSILDLSNEISTGYERSRIKREATLRDDELVADRAKEWKALTFADDWPCIEELAARAGVDVPALIRAHNAETMASGGPPKYSARTWDEEIEAAENELGDKGTEKEVRELALRRFWCLTGDAE